MLGVGQAGIERQVDLPCSAPVGWVGTDGTVEACGWAWQGVELNQQGTGEELYQKEAPKGTDMEPTNKKYQDYFNIY